MTQALDRRAQMRGCNHPPQSPPRVVSWIGRCLWIGTLSASTAQLQAANHLDTPTVIADPRADIGDLFAWMSTTVVG